MTMFVFRSCAAANIYACSSCGVGSVAIGGVTMLSFAALSPSIFMRAAKVEIGMS